MFDALKAYVDVTPLALAHPSKDAPPYGAPTWAVASRLKAVGATSNRCGNKEMASGAHEGRRGWCKRGRGSWRRWFERPILIAAAVVIHCGDGSVDGRAHRSSHCGRRTACLFLQGVSCLARGPSFVAPLGMGRRSRRLSLLFALAGLKGRLLGCLHSSSFAPLNGRVESGVTQPYQLPPVRASDGEELAFEHTELSCKGSDEVDVVVPLVICAAARIVTSLPIRLAGWHSGHAGWPVKHNWACHVVVHSLSARKARRTKQAPSHVSRMPRDAVHPERGAGR